MEPDGSLLLLQQRELTCSPARGGYADPAAACQGLADYVRLSRTSNGPVCSCPPEMWPAKAVGVFRGRPISLDLSACTACGFGSAGGADRQTLLPDLGT